MRRALLAALVVVAAAAFVVIAGGASSGSSGTSYKIELDNAFGLVNGADFKVAGVRAGTISKIDLCWANPSAHCQHPMDALVGVQVTQAGFGSFHADAFCQSRPQSLIGEYFVECQPGSQGQVLKAGSTITVNHTQSTIPSDLLQNVMRMPYRQRFTLIINELGAAVAGRSGDLQDALRRAVPALTETDNLLNLLANDSHTLQSLTANSDAVITALANNSSSVQRFIDEANRAATATATQDTNLAATFQKLPGFLEQLRPAMAKLGAATDANLPVLQNLNAASGQLDRLLTDLPGFAHASLPALQSLGKAAVTGKQAVQAAGPTIKHLNQFARLTPELAQNLAIVGHALDDRARAVQADPRSPQGRGYTGLEALLMYVFNQTLSINTFTNFGHQLTVDAFADAKCSSYATAATLAQNLKNFGAAARQCYAWTGPNQPGINERDPSNPGACVPDPGGAPPGHKGPATSACKLPSADVSRNKASAARAQSGSTLAATAAAAQPSSGAAAQSRGSASPPINLPKTIGQALSTLGIGSVGSVGSRASGALGGAGGATGAIGSATAAPSGDQAHQLLNYLLAP